MRCGLKAISDLVILCLEEDPGPAQSNWQLISLSAVSSDTKFLQEPTPQLLKLGYILRIIPIGMVVAKIIVVLLDEDVDEDDPPEGVGGAGAGITQELLTSTSSEDEQAEQVLGWLQRLQPWIEQSIAQPPPS